MLSKQVTAQVERMLDSHESDEPLALDYLQRLNLTGYDVKGQVSTALGQAGLGIKLDVGFDFGALIMPFLHLTLGVGVAGEATADGLLLLQRMPARLWFDDMVQPPQAPQRNREQPPPPFPGPDWSNRHPLALAFLRGETWRLSANASAKAWFGIGEFDDPDETGASIGAGASVDGGMVATRLIDNHARHYLPTPSDSSLNADVDDLFAANLKAKAAAWLIGTAGGVKELTELGVPMRSRVKQVADEGLNLVKGIGRLASAYDELTIPDVDAVSASGVFESVLKGLRAAARHVRDRVRQSKLTTDELLTDLDSARRELAHWIVTLQDPASVRTYGARSVAIMLPLAQRRLKQATTFKDALKRRQATVKAPGPAPAPPGPTSTFQLDLTSFEAHGDIKAGAKLVLPRDKVHLHLAVGADARYRRHLFRYQASVPAGSAPPLRLTQDTVITYVTRKLEIEGRAQGREVLKQRPNLVTMSYRSVLAQWLDVHPAPRSALPNGSGVSFGVSVLSESFGNYARACRDLAPKGPRDPRLPPLDAELQPLEAALTKQLRVGAEELRAFMRNCWSAVDKVAQSADAKEPIDSFVVESSHALTASVSLAFDPKLSGIRPDDLFKLAPVAAFIRTGQPGPELRLQVIRLRLPLRKSVGRSTKLVTLGWNPEPWGEDSGAAAEDSAESWFKKVTGFDSLLPQKVQLSALAVEVGIEIEAIRRVACEGIVDLHTQLYPHPYSHKNPPAGYGLQLAKKLEARHFREFSEVLVPPVALFSQ